VMEGRMKVAEADARNCRLVITLVVMVWVQGTAAVCRSRRRSGASTGLVKLAPRLVRPGLFCGGRIQWKR
jgi:hypothetical protein